MTKIISEEFAKESKLIKVIAISSSGGHGDRSKRIFGGHRGFYHSQWSLADRYFKRSKKERKAYFDKTNTKKVSDNNIFWENIQFLFSENGKIRDISEEHLGSEELNNFFKNATKSLQINENPYIIDEKSYVTDPIMKTINKYKHHLCILVINSKLSSLESFSFNKISNFDMEKEMKLLNIKKVTTIKNVPLKVLKSSVHSCSETLAKFFYNPMNIQMN